MKRRIIVLMFGLTLALATLSGCGGGEDDGEGVNPGLVEPGEDGEEGGDD
jgi:hypothetical protein